MKKTLLIALMLILGLVLVACGGAAPAEEAAVEEPAEVVEQVEPTAAPVEEVAPTEEPAPEPTAAPVMEVTDAQLDELFQRFIDNMEGYGSLGLEPFNEMLATDAPFLLDVREASELAEKGWIEGAVNVPIREVAARTDMLPAQDEPVVIYCGSGWRCTIALPLLDALGWQNTLALKGGSFGGWVEAGYPIVTGEPPVAEPLNAAEVDPALAAHFSEILAAMPEGYGGISIDDVNTAIAENPALILIDARTPEEIAESGSIDAPNVLFIPIEEFIARRAEWPAAKDAAIIVYCGSGHRSTLAMPMMWAYGYTNVLSMKGGFSEWAKAGYAIVGAPEVDLDTAFNTFLANMEGYNVIGLDAVNLALAEDPPPFLLDVREVSELEESGHIEGAVNLPIREVLDNPAYLPGTDAKLISYCGSGWRCTIAITALGALGYSQPLSMKEGSFSGWVEKGYPVVEGTAAEPMELNAFEPDPQLLAAMQEMLHNIPEGYGGISVEDLNTLLVENPDVTLIDVRTTTELEENGVIEATNWIHIPLEEFINQKDQWPAELDTPIVVYCGSGHRSTIAMTILWAYGYTDVLSMRGGVAEWVNAGYPVVDYVPEP